MLLFVALLLLAVIVFAIQYANNTGINGYYRSRVRKKYNKIKKRVKLAKK